MNKLSRDLTQRRLRHHTDHLEKHICCCHRCKLCICVIGRSHFDDVRAHDVKAIKSTKDGAQLARGPAASLGRSSSRCKRRVNGINIDREVDGAITDGITDLLDDTFRA